MGSRPITSLWLGPATEHEPQCRHVPINKIWRWTESTPRSGWWQSCGWNLQRLQHSLIIIQVSTPVKPLLSPTKPTARTSELGRATQTRKDIKIHRYSIKTKYIRTDMMMLRLTWQFIRKIHTLKTKTNATTILQRILIYWLIVL